MKNLIDLPCDKSLTDALEVGEAVGEDIVQYVINCLPPRTLTGRVVQLGEPYSHRPKQNGATFWQKCYPTYLTFVKQEDGMWHYAGTCFAGETTNIN